MPRLPPSPKFWLAAFLLWFGVLWTLSSSTTVGPDVPPLPYFDKIAHFGFFVGGSGLLSAFLYRLKPERPHWQLIIGVAVGAMAAVGALDEWHQSHVPGRSGNDIADWIADVLGGLSGALIFKTIYRRLRWFS